jgi:hypothetical protein
MKPQQRNGTIPRIRAAMSLYESRGIAVDEENNTRKKEEGKKQALSRIRHERELHAPGGSCGKKNFLKRDQQKTRRKEKINKKIKSKNGGRRIDWHVGESNARSNEHESGKCERVERERWRGAPTETRNAKRRTTHNSRKCQRKKKRTKPRESRRWVTRLS